MRHAVNALFLVVALAACQAGAGDASQKYGAEQKGEPSRHCRRCCREERGTREARGLSNLPVAPGGPIVESIPLMNAVPSMVSMPMMLATRSAAAIGDADADTDDQRVDELDARVEALHLRMMTIQRAVELQTRILEELRVSGSIGGTPLPGRPKPNAGN